MRVHYDTPCQPLAPPNTSKQPSVHLSHSQPVFLTFPHLWCYAGTPYDTLHDAEVEKRVGVAYKLREDVSVWSNASIY